MQITYRAEKQLMSISDKVYICPSCGSKLIVEFQVVKEGEVRYVVERFLSCKRCGVKIRQAIYLDKIGRVGD